VDIYILDEGGFEKFSSGEEFSYYGGSLGQKEFSQELRLPFQGYWLLVINNLSPEPAAVYYEVSG
jgi:hypothetical protein